MNLNPNSSDEKKQAAFDFMVWACSKAVSYTHLDIGNSACKIAIFDEDGQVKASASGDYKVYYPHPGWAEQNPEEWWQAVCGAVKRALEKGGIRPGEIAGIGIDGQSWSAIPIDKEGNVLANTPIWMDTRAADICEEVGARIGEDRIFEVCGNPFKPSYTCLLYTSTFGNDRYTAKEVSDAVYGAIEAGYRLFDCAAAYGNEKDIGEVFARAFSAGIVDRQELTIMTKVWNDMHGKGDVLVACAQSLRDLKLDYLDVYMVCLLYTSRCV